MGEGCCSHNIPTVGLFVIHAICVSSPLLYSPALAVSSHMAGSNATCARSIFTSCFLVSLCSLSKSHDFGHLCCLVCGRHAVLGHSSRPPAQQPSGAHASPFLPSVCCLASAPDTSLNGCCGQVTPPAPSYVITSGPAIRNSFPK